MEYKLSTASTYTPATASPTTVGAAGTYNVRYAAKTGYNAGATVDVVVPALAIGQSYQGGIIAYIDGTGEHGLIAAKVDQSTGIIWAVTAYQTISVPGGATGTAIGTGFANTNAIVTQNGTGYSTYAAGICYDYTNTDYGTGFYSDWYLPSKDELAKLYAMEVLGFGDFANYTYWSSSEYDGSYAWLQNLYNGKQQYDGKNFEQYVRAVRAF